jgi:ATP/maltotriose-dependent transcriptional regulator MalT
VVTEALLWQGNAAGAKAVAGKVQAIAERSEDRALRAALAPVVARAEAAGGDVAGALGNLRRSVAEATRLGFVAASLDGRFTLAELELRQGNRERARSALEAVRRDAEIHGHLRLAAAALAVRERVLKNAGQRTL